MEVHAPRARDSLPGLPCPTSLAPVGLVHPVSRHGLVVVQASGRVILVHRLSCPTGPTFHCGLRAVSHHYGQMGLPPPGHVLILHAVSPEAERPFQGSVFHLSQVEDLVGVPTPERVSLLVMPLGSTGALRQQLLLVSLAVARVALGIVHPPAHPRRRAQQPQLRVLIVSPAQLLVGDLFPVPRQCERSFRR